MYWGSDVSEFFGAPMFQNFFFQSAAATVAIDRWSAFPKSTISSDCMCCKWLAVLRLRNLTAAKEAPDHLYFSGHPRQHAEWERYYQDKAQILFFAEKSTLCGDLTLWTCSGSYFWEFLSRAGRRWLSTSTPTCCCARFKVWGLGFGVYVSTKAAVGQR